MTNSDKGIYAAISAIAVLSSAGYYLISRPPVHWTEITSEEALDYKGKYAEEFVEYLTSVKGEEINRWWEKAFKKLKRTSEEPITKRFREIKNDSNNKVNTFEDLKEACRQAYVSEISKVTHHGTSTEQEHYKEEEVWIFCSPFIVKPKTINDVSASHAPVPGYPGGTYGGSDTNKEMISVTYIGNEQFWERQNRRFAGEIEGDIKEWCGEAYRKRPSDTGYDAITVYEYCTLKGSRSKRDII